MSSIIPISRQFDQPTLDTIINTDPIVQRYRARFALFDWSAIDPPRKRGPGAPAHPQSAYLKAALVRINEQHLSTPRWRAYLLDHPLLVLELGFRPHIDLTQPYGFNVAKTVPSVRHLNNMLRALNPRLLANLFEQSVQALQQEIPGLGEVVAYDVKHIYASAQRKQLSRLRPRTLQERPAARQRPRLPSGGQKKYQSGAIRWHRQRKKGTHLGLRFRRRGIHQSRLWRCRAR
jgi:hypothetical protein